MKHHFDDLLQLGTPRWYDIAGVPRFCDFAPNQVSNIYACIVCLVELGCQGCNDTFDVAISYGTYELYMSDTVKEVKTKTQERSQLEKFIFDETSKDFFKYLTKEDWLKMFSYGDPPNHGCIGDSMGSYSLRIKQCWIQDKNMRWIRHKEYEIELDTKE